MQSKRFGLPVHVTRHAAERMTERKISQIELVDLIDTGMPRYKDDTRLWVAKEFKGRADNLICAAVVLEDRLVVKTVMHHFKWEK
ncbi:DUF4258 domain-containing protein [Halomonas sp. JS92-SW72]|uniref:DUF4258 domain-containing protein n=1 Tax=Halomonas sp. JS92-SW72 TaxID=2306583 RepID=UPI000E5C1164|nr:DUF4258 domain-containing protein [Halomonas sp. JS92-SW72]AXY43645.1 DUF4258 domain-containing protein [Halomonas sp. JS92-SW72]